MAPAVSSGGGTARAASESLSVRAGGVPQRPLAGTGFGVSFVNQLLSFPNRKSIIDIGLLAGKVFAVGANLFAQAARFNLDDGRSA